MVEVSRREAEVLEAIRERLSNAEIAAKLYISVRTVESHVSTLLRKFGVTDRHSLIDRTHQMPAPMTGPPVARTSFVGRDAERVLVSAALDHASLVTLLGPGGVGKSRLAAVVAEARPSPVTFVDLVPVRDGFVAQAVAAALGVAEGPHQPLEAAIAERLGDLLVLDNCEHVVASVATFAARLLTDRPELRVLATSRERLGVDGERLVAVEPLAARTDAVTLFRDRARALDPDFTADESTLAELCARLDGLPLAIELAAARSAALGPAGLLAAVDDRLRLLSGGRGRDDRHGSLRAVVDWSHHLLGAEAQSLFRRLAIFAGPFDLPAAVAVAGGEPATVADGLGRLVDHSLVNRDRSTGRWRLLATIRAYAIHRLETSGELAEVQRRHLAWAVETARWLGDGDFDAVAGDLRAALAAAPTGPDPAAHRLARSLGRLTFARRFLHESAGHFRRAADLAPTPAEAVADLCGAADCTFVSTTSGPETLRLLREAAERVTGDPRAIVLARAVETVGRYQVVRGSTGDGTGERLLAQARTAGNPDDPAVASALALAAAWLPDPHPATIASAIDVARRAGDPVQISSALDAEYLRLHLAGRVLDALDVTRQRLAQLPRMDEYSPRAAAEIGDVYIAACIDALYTGDLPAALAAARRLPADDLFGANSYVARCMEIPPLVLTGELDAALDRATRMWDGWLRAGRSPSGWMLPAVAMAALAHRFRDDAAASALWRSRLLDLAGPKRAAQVATLAFLDARAAVHTGDLTGAPRIVERAFAPFTLAWAAPYARAAGAELAVVAGLPDAADRLASATGVAAYNRWAAACLARATARHTGDPDRYAAAIAGWAGIDAHPEIAVPIFGVPGPSRARP